MPYIIAIIITIAAATTIITITFIPPPLHMLRQVQGGLQEPNLASIKQFKNVTS